MWVIGISLPEDANVQMQADEAKRNAVGMVCVCALMSDIASRWYLGVFGPGGGVLQSSNAHTHTPSGFGHDDSLVVQHQRLIAEVKLADSWMCWKG